MKNILILLVVVFVSGNAQSAAPRVDCGLVDIEDILTGPRHGALMEVSNPNCGGGWVCLDPESEFTSVNVSKRMFSFVLANQMAGNKVRVYISPDKLSTACGNYPVVETIGLK